MVESTLMITDNSIHKWCEPYQKNNGQKCCMKMTKGGFIRHYCSHFLDSFHWCDNSSLLQTEIYQETNLRPQEKWVRITYTFCYSTEIWVAQKFGADDYLHKMIWGCSAQHAGDQCPVHRSMQSSSWLPVLHHAHSSLQMAVWSSLRQPPLHAPERDLQCTGSREHGPPPVVSRRLPGFFYMLRRFKFQKTNCDEVVMACFLVS